MFPVKKAFAVLTLFCTYSVGLTSAGAGKPSILSKLAPGNAYTAYVLDEMSEVTGGQEAPKLYRAGVDSARAVIVEGKSAIVYNPTFLSEISRDAGTDWAAVSVLAHELGHHVYRHVKPGVRHYEPDVSRKHELEADYFSGYVLARLGTTLEEAEVAQRTYFDVRATKTHPASLERLRAIAAGWQDAQQGLPMAAVPAERFASVPEPVVEPKPKQAKPVPPSPQEIVGALNFFAPEEGW